VIPNEKLASDTIQNSSIVSREKLAEITVQVPLNTDLEAVVQTLRDELASERDGDVIVTGLEGNAAVTLRAWAPDEVAAVRLESDLRLRVHSRLRGAGSFSEPDEARRTLCRPGYGFPPPRQKRRTAVASTAAAPARRGALFLIVVGGLVAGGIAATAAFRSSCTLSSLRPVAIGENSFIYAADERCSARPGRAQPAAGRASRREPLGAQGDVAIEDRRFYAHGGVDYQAIAAAVVKDLGAGHFVQGGSTITQQLVRNLYISREKTLTRKLKEACLAIKLTGTGRRTGSCRPTEPGLHGNHSYGIEAASQTYFSRRACGDADAAALIAGLPQAPSVYDPFHRPTQALARRDEVLRSMLDSGRHHGRAVHRGRFPARPAVAAGPPLHAHSRAVLLQLRA